MYSYGYDLAFINKNDERPFLLENTWSLIWKTHYDELLKKSESFERVNIFQNGDKVFLADNSKIMFPKYKIESYCEEKGISISFVNKMEDANLLIIDIKDALYPLSYATEVETITYPIKHFEKFVSEDSLRKAEVKAEDEYIVLTQESINKYEKYFPIKTDLVKRNLMFLHVFSKEETEAQLLKLEPLAALEYSVIHNVRIVSYEATSEEIHTTSSIFDDEMFLTLKRMFSSSDLENKTLAINMIADCNRKESIKYLIPLYIKNTSAFSGSSEKNVKEFNKYMDKLMNSSVNEKSGKEYLTKIGISIDVQNELFK